MQHSYSCGLLKTIPLEASVAANLITQKVGVSIKAREGYILCAMYVVL